MATTRGRRQLDQRLRKAQEAIRSAIDAEQEAIAEDVLRISRDLAPQLTGLMIEDSGIDVERTRDRIDRSVFYRQVYALFQHEGFYNPGPITAQKPGAGRKFLTRAFVQVQPQVVDRMKRRIERALQSSLG